MQFTEGRGGAGGRGPRGGKERAGQTWNRRRPLPLGLGLGIGGAGEGDWEVGTTGAWGWERTRGARLLGSPPTRVAQPTRHRSVVCLVRCVARFFLCLDWANITCILNFF